MGKYEETSFLNVQLYVSRILLMLGGTWPAKFGHIAQKIYNYYFSVGFVYILCFIICQLVEAAEFLMLGEIFLCASNMTITLSYLFGSIKAYFCQSDSMRNLIRVMQQIDNYIESNQEIEELQKIYKKYVRTGNYIALLLSILGYTTCVAYVVSPVYEVTSYSLKNYNGTAYEGKKFILSLWLPFDPYKHYYLAYGLQVLAGFFGPTSVISCDAFISNTLIFASGQLEILQHYLQHIHVYVEKLRDEAKIPQDIAESIVMKNCIKHHENIIRFVKHLDDQLNIFMLSDFLVASVRIAFILTQISENMEVNIISFLGLVLYVSSLLAEVFSYYWFANEIILQSSEGITRAISESNWYELSLATKKKLLFMMMRANIPSQMSIGHFCPMSLQAAQQIFNTCYYYLCVMNQ